MYIFVNNIVDDYVIGRKGIMYEIWSAISIFEFHLRNVEVKSCTFHNQIYVKIEKDMQRDLKRKRIKKVDTLLFF